MEQLASKAGVAKNAINALENGRGNPTVKTLDALSRALGVPLIEFFGARIPATQLNDSVLAGLKQETKAKRNREAAQMLGARGKRVDASSYQAPEDLAHGLEFVSRFAGLQRDMQLAVMALVYENPRPYLARLSPEFLAQLARLLSVAKK